MKANQQLLSQLIEEKPAASEREAFIKYVADSLRAAPVDEYKKMRTKICTLIDSQKDAPEPPRPPQAMSAPPVIHQHEIYQQYQQQQPVQQYQQYQQYQQQQPVQQYQQYQQYQQQQPVQQYQQQQPIQQYQQQSQGQSQSQSQMPSTSIGERLSAGSLTQLLSSSQDVLDGSLNLSSFSVDSQLLGSGSRRTNGQSLNTLQDSKIKTRSAAENSLYICK